VGPPAVSSPGATMIARSALLTLTASPADDSLALRIDRVADHRLVTGPGKVTATLDGHAMPLAPQPNGSWLLSLHGEAGGAHSLAVVVDHDGIRELLTGTVTAPRRQSALDILQGHGMAAWWVLNIAVVLIAVMVISRRRR
jgi:hypothetical protein